MTWRIAATSARGSSHLRSGLPNQDAFEYRNGDRSNVVRAVLAVSDGHGGARHFRSHVGSSFAANTAVRILHDSLSGGAEFEDSILERICNEWRSAVSSDLELNPLRDEELNRVEATDGVAARDSVVNDPVLAYGATLLAAAITDDFAVYMQLGDGDILAVDDMGHTTRPIPADERLIANQTTSLCQMSAVQEFRSVIARDFPALVLVSTDGYANSFRSEADFLKIGGDYLGIVREQGLDGLAEELPGILSNASREGSGDDITLGLLHRTNSSSTGATGAREVTKPVLSRPPEKKKRFAGAAVAVLGACAAVLLGLFFRGFSHSAIEPIEQPLKPVAAAPIVAPPPKPPAKDPPKTRKALALEPGSGGPPMEVKPGDKIAFRAFQPDTETPDEPYAEVRRNAKGALELVNLSDDTWTVQQPGRKAVDAPVANGEAAPLAANIKITFRTTISAMVRVVDMTRP